MAFLLEDGSGLSGSNSYASEDALNAYADDRGVTLASGDAEAALVRGSAAIDSIYRGRFPGYKRNGRAQAMEWPRSDAYDNTDELIAADEIPVEIVQASCEAAIRELTEPGSMMPDLDRGGGVRRLKAGSVEIEYGANASNQTTFSAIDKLLSGLITGGDGGGLFVTAARG